MVWMKTRLMPTDPFMWSCAPNCPQCLRPFASIRDAFHNDVIPRIICTHVELRELLIQAEQAFDNLPIAQKKEARRGVQNENPPVRYMQLFEGGGVTSKAIANIEKAGQDWIRSFQTRTRGASVANAADRVPDHAGRDAHLKHLQRAHDRFNIFAGFAGLDDDDGAPVDDPGVQLDPTLACLSHTPAEHDPVDKYKCTAAPTRDGGWKPDPQVGKFPGKSTNGGQMFSAGHVDDSRQEHLQSRIDNDEHDSKPTGKAPPSAPKHRSANSSARTAREPAKNARGDVNAEPAEMKKGKGDFYSVLAEKLASTSRNAHTRPKASTSRPVSIARQKKKHRISAKAASLSESSCALRMYKPRQPPVVTGQPKERPLCGGLGDPIDVTLKTTLAALAGLSVPIAACLCDQELMLCLLRRAIVRGNECLSISLPFLALRVLLLTACVAIPPVALLLIWYETTADT